MSPTANKPGSRKARARKPTGAFGEKVRARRRALQAIYQWTLTGQPAADILDQFHQEQDMKRVDTDYFTLLVTETIDRAAEIDPQLQEHLDRPMEQLDALEASVLRLAACELLYHIEVPYRAVLDQAIELAKHFGSDQTPVFVNGVLDRCAAQWRKIEVQADQ